MDLALETAGAPRATAGRGARVCVTRVEKSYGAVKAVREVSLQVNAGEFVSLLGPSGSGKTSLLMIIAGFEVPDAGSVHIGDRDVTRAEPNDRNLGMVFQRYALFPHLSVADNIAFPLKMRKFPRQEIARKVELSLERVRLAGYGSRKPDQLSGGQQQRVALARATVFDPPVILMDEPLGALDKKLREQMQVEIKHLQRQWGSTVIYVTHDQQEALTMSDRVAVMNQGRIEQICAPRELYDRPASAFVADFVGDTNWLAGVVQSIDGSVVSLRLPGGQTVRGTTPQQRGGEPLDPSPGRPTQPGSHALQVGDRARLCIRPERLLQPTDPGTALAVRVIDEIYAGPDITLMCRTADGLALSLRAAARDHSFVPDGDGSLAVSWRTEDAFVFPEERPGP